jgi:hypothetical protein
MSNILTLEQASCLVSGEIVNKVNREKTKQYIHDTQFMVCYSHHLGQQHPIMQGKLFVDRDPFTFGKYVDTDDDEEDDSNESEMVEGKYYAF